MSQSSHEQQSSINGVEAQIANLYQQLLDCWNRRDATAYAALFETNGLVIGFDGSQMHGRTEIETTIGAIFTDHATAAYVGKVRNIRLLSPEVVMLHAICGMVPPGASDLNPAANAIQTVVAVKQDDGWQIAHFQNTPAQFHGRPQLSEALTNELRELL